MKHEHSIFTEFLWRLRVPATAAYSDAAFAGMPFRSLFGFGKLLQKYGVENEAYALGDKTVAATIPTPFLAQYGCSFVVVDAIGPEGWHISDGNETRLVSTDEFMDRFGGTVLLAYPGRQASEPKVRLHRFIDFGTRAKRWVLGICVIFLALYLIVSNGLYTRWSYMAVLAVDALGFYASYLLTLKSTGIRSEAGDAICGVIERTGCHTILGTSASRFFGLFGWSEVGLAYFGVSLAALLVFPEYSGAVALCNALACPFSFWSVWYQKFRAKAWCTLCLTVQGCLWLALACEFFGGWFGGGLSIGWPLAVLVACYVGGVLAVEAVAETFSSLTGADQNVN